MVGGLDQRRPISRRPDIDPKFKERLNRIKTPEQISTAAVVEASSLPDFKQALSRAKSNMGEPGYRELCATTHAAVLEYYKDTTQPLPKGVPAFLANAETDEILQTATFLRQEKGEVVN